MPGCRVIEISDFCCAVAGVAAVNKPMQAMPTDNRAFRRFN